MFLLSTFIIMCDLCSIYRNVNVNRLLDIGSLIINQLVIQYI